MLTSKKGAFLARWQKRQLPSQLFAVVRHAERADSVYSFYQGQRWTQTLDFHRFPVDPPLSDAGLEAASTDTGRTVRDFVHSTGSHVHIVVTSPYFRCVQTAVEICRSLCKVRLLVDRSLGEIFGPQIMGDDKPNCPVRPMESVVQYARSRGVRCMSRAIGEWPVWPEDLKAARRRYANRFLTFLQRSTLTKRNFIIVTHGDCVGAALSMMPSQLGTNVQKIDFGGMFMSSRRTSAPAQAARGGNAGNRASSCGAASGSRKSTSIVPVHSMSDDEDGPAMEAEEIDSPKLWKTLADLEKTSPGWGDRQTSPGTDPHMPPNSARRSQAQECHLPEPPKASDGWEVKTHAITLGSKVGGGSMSIFTKKVTMLLKNSKFSKEQVERLLGQLSDRPLGGRDDEGDPAAMQLQAASLDQRSNMPGLTSASLSTYMFGASEFGTHSEIPDFGSDVGSEFGGGESRSNTLTSMEGALSGGNMDVAMARLQNGPNRRRTKRKSQHNDDSPTFIGYADQRASTAVIFEDEALNLVGEQAQFDSSAEFPDEDEWATAQTSSPRIQVIPAFGCQGVENSKLMARRRSNAHTSSSGATSDSASSAAGSTVEATTSDPVQTNNTSRTSSFGFLMRKSGSSSPRTMSGGHGGGSSISRFLGLPGGRRTATSNSATSTPWSTPQASAPAEAAAQANAPDGKLVLQGNALMQRRMAARAQSQGGAAAAKAASPGLQLPAGAASGSQSPTVSQFATPTGASSPMLTPASRCSDASTAGSPTSEERPAVALNLENSMLMRRRGRTTSGAGCEAAGGVVFLGGSEEAKDEAEEPPPGVQPLIAPCLQNSVLVRRRSAKSATTGSGVTSGAAAAAAAAAAALEAQRQEAMVEPLIAPCLQNSVLIRRRSGKSATVASGSSASGVVTSAVAAAAAAAVAAEALAHEAAKDEAEEQPGVQPLIAPCLQNSVLMRRRSGKSATTGAGVTSDAAAAATAAAAEAEAKPAVVPLNLENFLLMRRRARAGTGSSAPPAEGADEAPLPPSCVAEAPTPPPPMLDQADASQAPALNAVGSSALMRRRARSGTTGSMVSPSADSDAAAEAAKKASLHAGKQDASELIVVTPPVSPSAKEAREAIPRLKMAAAIAEAQAQAKGVVDLTGDGDSPTQIAAAELEKSLRRKRRSSSVAAIPRLDLAEVTSATPASELTSPSRQRSSFKADGASEGKRREKGSSRAGEAKSLAGNDGHRREPAHPQDPANGVAEQSASPSSPSQRRKTRSSSVSALTSPTSGASEKSRLGAKAEIPQLTLPAVQKGGVLEPPSLAPLDGLASRRRSRSKSGTTLLSPTGGDAGSSGGGVAPLLQLPGAKNSSRGATALAEQFGQIDKQSGRVRSGGAITQPTSPLSPLSPLSGFGSSRLRLAEPLTPGGSRPSDDSREAASSEGGARVRRPSRSGSTSSAAGDAIVRSRAALAPVLNPEPALSPKPMRRMPVEASLLS